MSASLICVFISFQLVLFSTLPKYLHSFCVHKWCTLLFFWKYINLCYVWCIDSKCVLRLPCFHTAVSVSGRKLCVYIGWHEMGRWGVAILKIIPLWLIAAFLMTGNKITLSKAFDSSTLPCLKPCYMSNAWNAHGFWLYTFNLVALF
jgi:hypothetical protein